MRVWLNINRNGGLGNRLFSRAHVYAAALEFGATVVDWGLGDCSAMLPNLGAARMPIYPMGRERGALPAWTTMERLVAGLRKFRPRGTGALGPLWSCNWRGGKDPDTMALDSPAFADFVARHQYLILNGFKLRCVAWVGKHAAEIRHCFRLPSVLAAKWDALQAQWHQEFQTTIAVHMRAGDFRFAQGGRYYLPPEGYAEILRRDPQLDPTRTLYILFSDESFRSDTAFNSLGMAFAGLNFQFHHGDMLDDLAGMSSCDRILGPATSTFSRWAAFSGDRPWAGVVRDNAAEPISYRKILPWDY